MTFSELYVRQKLTEAATYQEELGKLLASSDEEILRDSGKLHVAERLLQLIVDTLIDINQHFIKELNLAPVEDFQSTFLILGEHGVLPKDFATKISPVVGLRNRVVHRYESLDKSLFIKSLRNNYRDFDMYRKYVETYLATKFA